jgi:cation diffusion facilitator CzcD-associated flavoprotein CzcO
VLDAGDGPGGAWRHRWPSLTWRRVHGLYPLPGLAAPEADPAAPAASVVPPYFADYERKLALHVRRPVQVRAVRRQDDRADSPLLVETTAGTWAARAVVNATGTWTRPFRPHYPGVETFGGRQLHTAD